MSIKSVLVCVSLLLFTVSGFGQVFHKVDLTRGTGGVGVLRISSSVIAINGTCAAPNCAEIDIDGKKLPEYLMACLNKMEAGSQGFDGTNNSINFAVIGSKYEFTFTSVSYAHWLKKLAFYYDNTNGTNIEITLQNNSFGIIRLLPTAGWTDQRKTDYMVSMLVEAITRGDPNTGENQTKICFSKGADDVITSMLSVKDAGSFTCTP